MSRMTLLVSMFVLGAGGALADSPVPRDARGFSAPVILDEADPWSYRTPPAEPIVPAPPRGRYAMDDQVRAGYPDTLSRWAVRSVTPAYSAGWVGGGTLLPGQPRYIHADGVWGFDYDGWLLNRRIWLGWSHGRRYQGGRGAYDSEGPPKASHFLHTRLEEARERRSGHKE